MKRTQRHHGFRHASPGSSSTRGLTLIEVLAVIVILSAVTAVATVGLASTSEEARLRAVAADVRDIDAYARLLARTDGAAAMSMHANDGDGESDLRLHLIATGELVRSVDLPPGASVHLALDGTRGVTEIVFDSHGRSVDYEVEVALGDRSLHVRVAGLSGLTWEIRP